MVVRFYRPGRLHAARAAAVALLLATTGCGLMDFGRWPSPAPPQPRRPTPAQPAPPAAPAHPGAPEPAHVENWEAFSYSTAALRERIASESERLEAGSASGKPAAVASLRMAAEARDALVSGAVDHAVDTLERAIALDGKNGFAYLYLVYAHHQRGRYSQAQVFAEKAARHLPHDEHVFGELEGLRSSIRLNTGPEL